MTLHRSYLFAPGNHPRKLEKVFEAGADAVILDLEDAVAVAEKEATRPAVVAALQRPRPCRGYVRINALETPFAFGDLEAVVAPGVDGIVVPKIETPARLATAEWVIGQFERRAGLTEGAIDILPIVETGLGVANVREIARAATRVRRLSFGAGDYVADTGLDWPADEATLAHARAEIALASRAAGLEPPIDSVWIDLKDSDGLAASAARVKSMGYQGKLCIHPAQLGPVHAAFTPTPEEVARARRIVAAFEEAEAAGSASIQLEGGFIDYPIVEKARQTLAVAAAAGAAEPS